MTQKTKKISPVDKVKIWKKENNIPAPEFRILMELFRRREMFRRDLKNSEEKNSMLLFKFPNQVKDLVKKGYLKPKFNFPLKEENWYDLTSEGEKFLKQIKWHPDLNIWIFKITELKMRI